MAASDRLRKLHLVADKDHVPGTNVYAKEGLCDHFPLIYAGCHFVRILVIDRPFVGLADVFNVSALIALALGSRPFHPP